MRTIYLISRAKSGAGPVNQTLNILEGMKQNGRVTSTLVTLAPEWDDASWLYRFKDKGISIYQMNHELLSTWRCIFELRNYVRRNNIEIVHACGFRADFVALFAGRHVKKIITQRCHPKDTSEKLPRFLQSLCSWFYLKMIKKMDAIVACSKSIQEVFLKEYGMNVFAVQNGVNTDFFKPLNEEEKCLQKERLGLKKVPIYLVLGSLRDRKNNILLINAMNKIDNFPGQVVIVGAGPEESMLKKAADNNPNILFVGSTKTPIDYLQASDFLISCSLAEGLPNTVLEAISCGIVPILSNIGPHKEIVEGTSVEHIFERDSVNDLKRILLQSPEWDRVKQSSEARRIAIEKFGISVLAKQYEDIYSLVTNNQVN